MSTVNQAKNDYTILLHSIINDFIKTIVIRNTWRLYLHSGNQIN